MKPKRLQIGDTIGIIAPSYPVSEKEILPCVEILKARGFKVKLGKNLYKRSFYSAGSPKERAFDLNSMFKDKNVKAIMCATGGMVANQILDLIDYDAIKENPKIFIGYSDITILLLAIYKKTGLVTFHGPNLHSLRKIEKEAEDFLFSLLMGERVEYYLPSEMKIIREGEVVGKLIGGNLHLSNSILGTKYNPNYDNKIWFCEDLKESPASLDQKFSQFKLSGNLENISGIVIGNLLDCVDAYNKENNRSIGDIVLELTKGYDFPIVKVPYFGHGVSNFYTFPIGVNAEINTKTKEFKIIENPVL